jgi:hypothetical protein
MMDSYDQIADHLRTAIDFCVMVDNQRAEYIEKLEEQISELQSKLHQYQDKEINNKEMGIPWVQVWKFPDEPKNHCGYPCYRQATYYLEFYTEEYGKSTHYCCQEHYELILLYMRNGDWKDVSV